MFVEVDGIPVDVDAAPSWQLTRGVAPYTLDLEMTAGQAQGLFEEGEIFGSTLKLQAEDNELEVQGLTILGLSATNNVNTVKLTLADRRWTMPYKFVSRFYNVRRKSLATKVAAAGQADSPEVANAVREVAADVTYAQWSLRNGQPWTAAQVLEDVLDRVVGPDNWEEQDDALSGTFPDIEGLEIKAQGDTAVSQAVAALGGSVDVYVDPTGKVRVYLLQDGGEFTEVGITESVTDVVFRPIFGRPLFAVQDNRRTRPQKFRVLFERLIEGRVDFREGDDELTVTQERGGGDPIVPIRGHNVFPMPEDGSIPAVGNRAARTVVKGSWVTLADLLAFFAANPADNTLAAARPLTVELIRRLWYSPGLDTYASPFFDKGRVWATRIGTIREHYRRTYRVIRPWVDRIRQVQPYRVAIEDQETGARSPATVYQDYSVVHAWIPYPTGNTAEEDERRLVQTRVANAATFPTGGTIVDTATTELTPAPALLRILDNDQAILQVSFVTDFSGTVDRYERSATRDVDNATDQFDGRQVLLQDEQLSADHEVSILLTFVMASPNDLRRFHAVDVSLADAESLLPAAKSTSRAGEGPVLEVRVGAPRAAARFAWDDNRREQFYRAFAGILDADDEDPQLGTPINQEELEAIARAVAAREAARFRDHPEGALNTTFRPEARIRGTVSSVVHTFTGDDAGGALTAVELDPEPPALDLKAVLSKDVRRLIDGFVER